MSVGRTENSGRGLTFSVGEAGLSTVRVVDILVLGHFLRDLIGVLPAESVIVGENARCHSP